MSGLDPWRLVKSKNNVVTLSAQAAIIFSELEWQVNIGVTGARVILRQVNSSWLFA